MHLLQQRFVAAPHGGLIRSQRPIRLGDWGALIGLLVGLHSLIAHADRLTAEVDASGDRIVVHRDGEAIPIVTQVAAADFRPYLHPLMAPDGRGVLTEYSPGHHKHQTGLFWGFTRVNGRDYFHHPEGSHWKRVSISVLKAAATRHRDDVQWQTVYDLLDEEGVPLMRESQIWSMQDLGDHYLLDLQWTGQANRQVTIGEYDYGGLFLRMPWKEGVEAHVTNSARQLDARAEGGRAVWVDIGMHLDQRTDEAHVAIFDHPKNHGFPLPWRVDNQFGVGPVRARIGNWTIDPGRPQTIRHRLVAYTGDLDDVALTKQWSSYSGQSMAYAQWHVAQQEGRRAEFLTPEQAVKQMTLAPGFAANVYAAEPMITQPMAFCWDSRGRLWIAENRDYETRQSGYSGDGNSRILILEDSTGDGVADKREVFLEGIPFPAGMAVGMGGLWLGAPPNLLFVPDRDNDDRADMDDIEVRLTGWGIRDRHETLNSFIWGPDGWLYGCQGFATPSRVGKPVGKGTIYRHNDPFPTDIELRGDPVDINGGVWRYHPQKERFEVVAHGFSNPWGIDYDAHGQLLITACVIPHLWHVIPGGIYHRQGGSHFNPHVYSDIRTIADHRHRSAHGGARVYLSDAFQEKYHGRLFMANIHEHAVLTDILEPRGSGYVGRHGDDFALANNAQWIGFSVEIGPDGALYVLDWHDADICGKEVLNKQTGRVFRIAAQPSAAAEFAHRYDDLTQLDDLSLAKLQRVQSAWHARRARVILQHRASSRIIEPAANESLKSLLAVSEPSALRLRALWSLHAIGHLPTKQLLQALGDTDEHVRAWAIQLLCEDYDPPGPAIDQFARMARTDVSPVVRLYLAAAALRLNAQSNGAASWPIIEALAERSEDANDHNLPKLLWFGLEPLVLQQSSRALELAASSQIPLLTRHVARRLADAEQFEALLARMASASSQVQLTMLLGLRDAFDGQYDVKSPAGWSDIYPSLRASGGETARIALQLSRQFGDSVSAEMMLATLLDVSASDQDRREALQGLAGSGREELRNHLAELLADQRLRRDAIRAIAAYDDVSLGSVLLEQYPDDSESNQQEIIQTLSTRSSYGSQLTDAIGRGQVPKRDVPAYVARLLHRTVGNRFVDVWGSVESLGVDETAMFTKYRALLTDTALSGADASRGRAVFQRACAACHRLYGHGGQIGPDITGANRTNLEYLLGNVLTPSAIIQDAYKMHIVLTDEGRIYAGIPAAENDRHLKLRVADREHPVTIPKSRIESREISSTSMMPTGTLTNLSDQEVIDLFAYLQKLQQVPLPSEAE